MDMVRVKSCDASECNYNADEKCHAIAISIGVGRQPVCDNFLKIGEKMGISEIDGIIGACSVENCQFNRMLECGAEEVLLKKNSVHVECYSFRNF